MPTFLTLPAHVPLLLHCSLSSPCPTSQILDELIISGEMQESSKKSVLRVVSQSDAIEDQENSEDGLARIGSRSG